MKVKYEYKLGIQKYFEKKKKYATLANIKREDILYFLKNNLPTEMKPLIGAYQPTSYSDFLRASEEAED